jgi:hypothetical protein
MSVMGAVSIALLGTGALLIVIAGRPVHRSFTPTGVGEPMDGWSLITVGEPLYIPAAAHVAGAAGTDWRSDLELYNVGNSIVQAEIALLVQDQANLSPAVATLTLDPGTALRSEDVLLELFGFSGSAALRISTSNGQIMATSRTYNQTDDGTYGQFIGGIEAAEAIGPGDEARIILLRHDRPAQTGYRTNLGLLSCAEVPAQVDVELYDGQGSLLGTTESTLQPLMFTQLNRVFEAVTANTVDNGYAVVSSSDAGACFLAYASVVDNETGDPVYIPATVLDAAKNGPGEPVYVAAAAHVEGAGGAQWRTDLVVHNPDGIQATYEIALLRTDQNNTVPDITLISLSGGESRRLQDVLETEFGLEGTAALRITPAGSARALVASRTYNQTPSGTYGQFIGGSAEGEGITTDQQALMLQLSHQQGKTNTYRTNIGFVSAVETPMEVHVELFDADGTALGSVDASLGPYMHKQINRIFERVTGSDVADGYAIISTPTPNGRFMAYASVVDNRTADPVLVPATVLSTGVQLDPQGTMELIYSWLTNWLGQGSVPYVGDAISIIQNDGADALLDAMAAANVHIATRSEDGIRVSYPGGWVLSNGSVAAGEFEVRLDNVTVDPAHVSFGLQFEHEDLTIDGTAFPINDLQASVDLEVDASGDVRGTVALGGTGDGSTNSEVNTVTGIVEIDTYLCENYPVGGTITFQYNGETYQYIFDGECDGTFGTQPQCRQILDEVPPGSLALWEIVDAPENPEFIVEEVVSPFDGSTALRTQAIGNTLANCKSENINRVFDIGAANTSTSHLEVYAEFSFNNTYYNNPFIIVRLMDEFDQDVGVSHIYYGQGVLCGHYRDHVFPSSGWRYTELPSAAGIHRLDLTLIGENLEFNKIAFYLLNYACEGENSIVYDHLTLVKDCE